MALDIDKGRWLALFCLSLQIGCSGCDDQEDLEEVIAKISLTPELDLGDVPLGAVGQGVLTVQNQGTATLFISEANFVSSEGVFSLGSSTPETIAPKQSEAIVVLGQAMELGVESARLVLASNDPAQPQVEASVRMRVVEPPPCDDNNPCTNDFFNTDTLACEHSFADGQSCESKDRCILDAVCSLGVCLGQSKVCDDDDPCTQDVCRQVDGECQFLEVETVCDDDNPCTLDACDRETGGCSNTPVVNGSACDDGDLCTVGDLCVAGQCEGFGLEDGLPCDDGDSCTVDDVCLDSACGGRSLLEEFQEGEVVFTFPLRQWDQRAFLHRREVSLGDSGIFYGLDHQDLPAGQGLSHELFAMRQCGTEAYPAFSYRPPDANVLVSYVRRAIQVDDRDFLRLVVGVRQRPQDGFRPQTTTYVLDDEGQVELSQIQRLGGETGRSLLPDGSEVYGIIFPLTDGPSTPGEPSRQDLVIVREDVEGNVLWTHQRSSGFWAEFFGVAGPRVLFWSNNRFGALDFNTGALVWSRQTPFTSDEMALSAALDIGIIRTKPGQSADGGQLIAVEILEGQQIFQFPETSSFTYFPRTEPVISASGIVGVMMQRNDPQTFEPLSLEWVELDRVGQVMTVTPLPYVFPQSFGATRHEDFSDDPYPTVADDGIYYMGYGDIFFAVDPAGGGVRWTLSSDLPNAFTGTVPLLREDGILLINEGSRQILGIRTNGGQMSKDGWASFRHDGRRTNFTPAAERP